MDPENHDGRSDRGATDTADRTRALAPLGLDRRTAYIAGGSSGINLAIAQSFARQGVRVAMISRDAAKVSAAVESITASGGEAVGWSADVRDFDAVAATLENTASLFGPIDIVVSGAAGNFSASALSLSSNAFRTIVDIDLVGTFHVFRACFEHLRKGSASLIAISAPQGGHPAMFQAHACAAKAGVNMLVKCLALEWGPAGIRVNAISPGPIADTEGMARLAPGLGAEIDAMIALRRHGTKDEVADAALYLAGDLSRYVTGTILECDGGLALGSAAGDALTARSR